MLRCPPPPPDTAYVTQGISLQIPEPDYRGRVDMSRAFLRFTSGPPSPPFDVNPIGPDRRYVGKNEGVTATEKHAAPVVWKGLRKYRSRAVLIACAREVSSVIRLDGVCFLSAEFLFVSFAHDLF